MRRRGALPAFQHAASQWGQFHLLQKEFDRATRYLEIAANEVGASPAVHNDLAVAYLESNDPSQLEQARQELQKALEADPTFATAVFNLAVLYERSNAPDQAIAEWRHYLELDSKSGWATEAQSRLVGLSR